MPQRFEYKYHLDPIGYHRVRNALRFAMYQDPHGAASPNGRYLVRSIYFDTDNYQAYMEKLAGVPNRIKLRIRSYAINRADHPVIKIELKTRYGSLVEKWSQTISLADYDAFRRDRRWHQVSGPVADEFRRLVLLKGLKPKVIVDYDREAWIPIGDSDIRITFDHDLRFAQADNLFPTNTMFHSARPARIIMEIKTQKSQPEWLEKICRDYGLKSLPNSKYARAIEQTQDEICLPSSV